MPQETQHAQSASSNSKPVISAAEMDSPELENTNEGSLDLESTIHSIGSSSNNGTSASPTSSDSAAESGTQSSQGERQASITSASSTSGPSRPEQNRERATVPSACVQCRFKHLKCDGLSPCTRCSANNSECQYVRSRRGFKGPRRNGVHGKNSASSMLAGVSANDRSCLLIYPGGQPLRTPHIQHGLVTPPNQSLIDIPHSSDIPYYDLGQELVAFDPKAPSTSADIGERCIEAFYYHFYPAHPFLLPRHNFWAVRKQQTIEPLEACMRYVGSFYIPQAPTAALEMEAERLVHNPDYQRDGWIVQAMLLFTIGLDGFTFQEKALQVLTDARNLALELGMNKRDFAFMNAGGSEVLAESWRRTWWEMYVVDGMIAGVHQKSMFDMKDIPADVLLPCEEREFQTGHIPRPHSIQDFDDESFDGLDLEYSSFTYRIAAIRNLGRMITARQITGMMPDAPTIDRIDAYLVNWRLHLPKSKQQFISQDNELDEMLFQAHMITNAATIVLHRELSELDSSVARTVTSCAPHKPIVPGESYNVHAAKTIQAAQDISKLIQLPVPLIKHTHFFTCVVTLASIVHLSCWSVLMPVIHDDDLKQQLKLGTGALKTLCQVWPSANKAFGQVKGVAQEVWSGKKRAKEMGYWGALSDEEVMRSMIEDQNIMEELQLLN